MNQETVRTAIMGLSALGASTSAFFAARALKWNKDTRSAEIEKGRPYFSFLNFGLARLEVQ